MFRIILVQNSETWGRGILLVKQLNVYFIYLLLSTTYQKFCAFRSFRKLKYMLNLKMLIIKI